MRAIGLEHTCPRNDFLAGSFKKDMAVNYKVYLMESPEIIKYTWQQLVDRLTTRFINGGYQVVHFQHDDQVFGSCFIIWSNNEDALRLTWDGKECWFILEETLLPLSSQNIWHEIYLSPFEPDEHDTVYARNMIEEFVESLDR